MTDRLPKISIITPSFNQADYIAETIDSVRAQNYPYLEHMVIDGGSTDGTLAILQQYDGLDWVSEPDNGQADAINKGFKKSTGDIAAWLNSDDIYLPGALQHVADFFSRHPQIDIIYGDYHLIDQTGNVLLRKQEIPFDYNILLYGLDYISQPTTFFRCSVFERSGYLDDSLHYGLDWEYWLRLANDGCQFAHLPIDLAATRWHVDAKTLVAPPAMYAEHEAIRAKYWNKPRFKSPRWHKLYTAWLNKRYRFKRQLLKILRRRRIDFPPGDWVLRAQTSRSERI
ncbi:MAG: glycosyltransferase [Anaerolineae bacterium]|nr:glycosyltransferase [Anaerolineae bacterium]